ncbi:MAG: cellobiose phosphorylase [Lachnospiraceae bacterium]|nr:cellobiose phosphorylase [Lachnospiraceae bacterium]
MLCKKMTPPVTLSNGQSSFSFLDSGDAFLWMHDYVRINAFCGNPLDGSANNLYLRIYHGDDIHTYPLLGRRSKSRFQAAAQSLKYEGTAETLEYTVIFRLTPWGIWFWDVTLRGNCERADVIYSQDIGCAFHGTVDSNELYVAQYLGHSVFETENGFCVCSRQNMDQGGKNPYIQQGGLGIRIVSYSTDGTQFYGLSFKKTDFPQALQGDLPKINKQFELAQICLQTEIFQLNGTKDFSFYGLCSVDHPLAVTQKEFDTEISDACDWQPEVETFRPLLSEVLIGAPYASPAWSDEQVRERFPNRCLEEEENGKLLSFFIPENFIPENSASGSSHVVLQDKELASERPHGHILLGSFPPDQVPSGVVSSTNYMYGVFNCQTVAGNTDMNMLLSCHRGLLNVNKYSGQRIYVRLDGSWRCLTLPAAYQMDLSGSTWYYSVDEDVLVIHSYAVYNRPEIVLSLHSELGRSYDIMISHNLTADPDEFDQDIILQQTGDTLTALPAPDGYVLQYCPDFHFTLRLPEKCSVSDDRVFFADGDPRNPCMMTLSLPECSGFTLVMQGRTEAGDLPFAAEYSHEKERALFSLHYDSLLRHFRLRCPGSASEEIRRYNAILPWYAHDAMIHFASPHGLEQSGGAAWGTRDVCQGPMEFFLACGHFAIARDILLRLYGRQLLHTGEWPQWFMFDQYQFQQEDCHGDIVFWPMKALADYLSYSGDFSILRESVDYRLEGAALAGRPQPVLEHLKKCVEAIERRFLPGTHLISYAGGDWDDTLQPASPRLKECLVSAWTQALASQTLRLLSDALSQADPAFAGRLSDLAASIAEDFDRCLVKDGIIAGFAYSNPGGSRKYLLHPLDRETGIHYRLLPLTRSMIAQLADQHLAEKNLEIISEKLSCPDGVRLMDHPARYQGGISRIFVRAEQAANVGREISLQYVHAHIRYIEAMAVYGRADLAWEGLSQITPVLIRQQVPGALPRQSNVYFSSSEGCFHDRYEFDRNFDLLRTGRIPVKCGWRLYSSGPGIYTARLIGNLLGIRPAADHIVLDPVVPAKLDGMELTFACFGRTVTFLYRMDSGAACPLTVTAGGRQLGTPLHNRYRTAGVCIEREEFLEAVAADPTVLLTIRA